jgi:Arc/MetJ-type ribon-helix-helix transcriptional regulator
MYMAQMNLHLTAEFERALARFMRLRKLSSKSEAVRIAVQEAAEREVRTRSATDFREWLGKGHAAPPNPAPRFATDDDLWR